MWGEIILTLTPSLLEALGFSYLKAKQKVKISRHLKEIIEKEFNSFSDTSLDCGTFYNYVKSTRFIELIRNYFFMINDNKSIEEYRSYIINLIHEEDKSINAIEINRFLLKVEELYKDSLCRIVEDNLEINAAFQLMSFSHREIISKIQNNYDELMRYLISMENRSIPIDDTNIKRYHEITEKEFGEIRFTGICGAERQRFQNINKFYVENTFSYFGKEFEKLYDYDDETNIINLKNFFDFGNKIILIGGAGLGKSTTLNYLFCNYEKLYNSNALKIKIDLKEYAEEIGKVKKGILWCVAKEFNRSTQYNGQTIEETQIFIAEKLKNGSCLIILDALDEISTQSVRDTVRREIETFTSVYYLNRFIISTREAGYLKNRFDDTFLHIRINKFGPEQIQKYSENWYNSYYENSDGFERFWDNFTRETSRARCSILIGNPIILILALVIFDAEKSLPSRRIEFYKKCVDTFLTERENRKAAFELEDKAKSILAIDLTVPKIAYYKYNKISNNSGYKFSSEELRTSIMDAIDVDDAINWQNAVNQYAEYLVQRTELIQEKDDDVFDFAHKTFYEYFLAFYFCKMYDNNEIIDLLYKWIGDSNYDELARLVVETVIQNNDPKQHDAIVNALFDTLNSEIKDEDMYQKKHDVFSVVSDLFTHSLLQPKFQNKYHLFIFNNPRFVDVTNRRLHRNHIDRTLYDADILAKMFINEFNNDNLLSVIDMVKYLNNDFRNKVIMSDTSGLLYHINQLFLLNFDMTYKDDKKSIHSSSVRELNYFLNDGIEFILKYPQVFISVISLSLMVDQEQSFEKIFDYKFNPTNIFYQYTTPRVLFELIRRAKNSKIYFAVLLCSITSCTSGALNSLFAFVLKRYQRINDKMENDMKEIASFFAKVWTMFNNSNSVDEFENKILKAGLYEESYKDVYSKAFLLYVENDKKIDYEETKALVTELNSSLL